jgi:hypothetical protein
MKWSPPIRSEKEFQEWLASVLEAERERLRKDPESHDFQLSNNLEVVMNDPAKEIQHHEYQR